MLYHFSEDCTIRQFIPRLSPAFPDLPPVVWAIDREHAPLYYFPRDCPRVAFWKRDDTTPEDTNQFLSYTTARKVIAVEGAWLQRIQDAEMYVYHFADDSFVRFDEGAGYFISKSVVEPIEVEPVGGLLERLLEANVEVRVTPTLQLLSKAVVESSLQFSLIRMRNAIKIPE